MLENRNSNSQSSEELNPFSLFAYSDVIQDLGCINPKRYCEREKKREDLMILFCNIIGGFRASILVSALGSTRGSRYLSSSFNVRRTLV